MVVRRRMISGKEVCMDRKEPFKKTDNTKGKEAAEYHIREKCLIIQVKQELDHHNTLSIREQSDKLLNKGQIRNIVFDFSGTDFMDSSGIGVIMGRYKKIAVSGGKIFVTGINNNLDRIFRMSGLYRIVPKFDSIEEAVAKSR